VGLGRFQAAVRLPRVFYPILAGLLALLVRLIPVILSWPYPAGFDTTAYYLPLMVKGIPDLTWVFHNFSLQQLVLSLMYVAYPNAFVNLSVFAILLQIGLSLSVYSYSLRVQRFSERTAFLTSTMFTFSLITLRLGWDQYRMMLALFFAILVLTVLASQNPRVRYLAVGFASLVILSNALPAALLILSLAVHLAWNYKRLNVLRAELVSLVTAVVVFGSQEFFITAGNGVGSSVPFSTIPFSLGLAESTYGLLFLLLMSWPSLILLPLGAFRRLSGLHGPFLILTIFCGLVPTVIGVYMVSPITVFWMASFPLAIMFGTVMKANSRRIVKSFAILMLIFTIVMGFSFVLSSPEAPTLYLSLSQSFVQYFPNGYLQSTVPLSQEGNLIALLDHAIPILPPNSTFVVPQQFYGLALMSQNPNQVRIVNAGQIGVAQNTIDPIPVNVNVNPITSLESMHGSFTVWWTQPNNWYGVSEFPSGFHTWLAGEGFSIFLIQ